MTAEIVQLGSVGLVADPHDDPDHDTDDTVGTDPGGLDGADERVVRSDAGWTLAKVLPLLAVVAFTAGSFGWYLGTRPDRPSAGSADIGFLQDMHVHHRQAVYLAALGQDHGGSRVRKLAYDVLIAQHRELGIMEAWLADWGYELQGADRTAMAWMADPRPVARMPGLASEADLADLAVRRGNAFDQRWLELLEAHHLGGVHMAESAARRAGTEKVRAIARAMAIDQKIEVNQYRLARRELASVPA